MSPISCRAFIHRSAASHSNARSSDESDGLGAIATVAQPE